jgi:hypothetical protein
LLLHQPAMEFGRCTECALAVIEALGGAIGVVNAARSGRLAAIPDDQEED